MKFWTVSLLTFSTLVLQAQQRMDSGRVDAIIGKAIQNRAANDPEKKLETFAFKSYTKLIVTANPDSVRGQLDVVTRRKLFGLGAPYQKVDSTQYKLKQFIGRQHFFETEKISQTQFDGKFRKETVVATKMSGFREPIYEVLGFNLQSFSMYEDNYELLETKYNSPISDNALQDYNYRLIDSFRIEGRKVYEINFVHKRKEQAGLQGTLWIDARNFAIARADMRVKGVINITGFHDFTYLEDEQIWFPKDRKFKITKGTNDEDIRIPGTIIEFDAANALNPKRRRQISDVTYLLSETNNVEFELNKPVKIRKKFIAIEVKDDAIKKDDAFWADYKKDTVDVREKPTYHALDSIVAKEKIDKKLRLGRKIINGYVPFGPFDLDLRYLLSYNNYEGFRIGLGGVTNDRFSNVYRIESYAAYGTKDGAFKYNFGAAARVGKFSNTWVGFSYTDDVREIASTQFAIDKRVFKLYDPRPINVSTFYGYTTQRVYIETKIIPKTESIWQITQAHIDPKFDYVFFADGKAYSNYNMATAMVSLQWNPFSDYMQTPVGRIETEKRYPKFTFQYTRSLPEFLGNDFDFGKLDLRAEYEKKYFDGQKTAVLVELGYADGDVPLTHLYNTSPNNLTKSSIFRRITLAGKNSFETMYFNEFFSSQFVMLQMKHTLKRQAWTRKIRPSIVLVTRMAWGDMKNRENHVGVNFKTLNEGYFESGVECNQIFKGLGLSGFYRYGPNGLPNFADNISLKISFIFNIFN
jgi:hypothetical protein